MSKVPFITLNKSQIQDTLQNWFKVLSVASFSEICSEARPQITPAQVKKYALPLVTKFAEWYSVYELRWTDNEVRNYVIVIEDSRFDKLHLLPVIVYYDIFENHIRKHSPKPEVFVCVNYVMTENMLQHIPTTLLPCLYRFLSLCEIYPRLGSPGHLFGYASECEIVDKNCESATGYRYSEVFDYDVDVKICNGIPGEVLKCKRILYESCPYAEFYFRRIISSATNISGMNKSGICNWITI
jgi:hypothetical protein